MPDAAAQLELVWQMKRCEAAHATTHEIAVVGAAAWRETIAAIKRTYACMSG